MNKWIVRGLLLALLLASVNLGEFVRSRAGRGADIDSTVKHLLTHAGMSYRETRGLPGEALKSMVFDRPSCQEPLLVVASPRTFDGSALFDRVGAPGDVHFFAYLSRVSEQGARFSFFVEHLKHSVLALLAMTSYQPDGMMLMITEPRGCSNVPRTEWSLVWKTDYRLSVARDLDLSRQYAPVGQGVLSKNGSGQR